MYYSVVSSLKFVNSLLYSLEAVDEVGVICGTARVEIVPDEFIEDDTSETILCESFEVVLVNVTERPSVLVYHLLANLVELGTLVIGTAKRSITNDVINLAQLFQMSQVVGISDEFALFVT